MAEAKPALIPEILEHAGPLLQRYQVLFCDIWGVVHDGTAANVKACAALIRFREAGGRVILVSNAPVPKKQVQRMLDYVGVPDGVADDIVSSGDIALRHIHEKGYERVFNIGPEDRDAEFFSRSPAASVALDEAEAVVCTGLNNDRTETPDDYRALLSEAAKRKLPFVCANPDFVVDVGTNRFYCAGALGDLYEHLGGHVFWAGKPHSSAYTTAMTKAQALQGDIKISPRDVLVIGDALRTDIEGAHRASLDALFIAGGLHREDVVENDRIQPQKLRALFARDTPPARAVMVDLVW